jgi:hypothetical protein
MTIEYGKGWQLVSNSEFEEFLRRYPPLTADLPLSKKSRFRRFLDLTLGPWPESQVATVHCSHRSTANTIRVDLIPPKGDGSTMSGPALCPSRSWESP